MNKIPPVIAAVLLLLSLPSMKRVHFIPTVETINATLERKMLNSTTALVTWTSTAGGEVGMVISCINILIKVVIVGYMGPLFNTMCHSLLIIISGLSDSVRHPNMSMTHDIPSTYNAH